MCVFPAPFLTTLDLFVDFLNLYFDTFGVGMDMWWWGVGGIGQKGA